MAGDAGWRRIAGRLILRSVRLSGSKMMNMKRDMAFAALFLLGCGAAGAVQLDGRLTGAWATSQADCQKLFVRGGKGLAYRQPVDEFAQAAIITPGQVVLPNQTCQVTGAKRQNGLTT